MKLDTGSDWHVPFLGDAMGLEMVWRIPRLRLLRQLDVRLGGGLTSHNMMGTAQLWFLCEE